MVAPNQDRVLSQTDCILGVSAERSTLKMEMELLVYFRQISACVPCPSQSLFWNVIDTSFLQMQIPATLFPLTSCLQFLPPLCEHYLV